MHALGLPLFVLPWYPVARVPVNLLHSLDLLVPGGMKRAAARGWREQQKFLRTMTGEPVEVGDSVPGLRSAA